jgi:hypothetical protein
MAQDGDGSKPSDLDVLHISTHYFIIWIYLHI